MLQSNLFDFEERPLPRAKNRSGTFTDNMKLPVHRWFRYSAGFSAEWAEAVIAEHNLGNGEFVFDPFAGSGTTILAGQKCGVPVAGVENHSFVFRVAKAKLLWNVDEAELLDAGEVLLTSAKARVKSLPISLSDLMGKCYSSQSLCKLEAIREEYLTRYPVPNPIGELLWLSITAILRECSRVGTAQWQYVLPNKIKANVRDPFEAFSARLKMFCADISVMKKYVGGHCAALEFCDARNLSPLSHLEGRVKLIVTSPPYPNNYDYADATRIEMTFWGEIERWGDLQRVIRHRLVRSCSQHSAAEKLVLSDLLSDAMIEPIHKELATVCANLESVRETRGGKKTYHTMIAAYFGDLARTFKAIYPLCAEGANICFVVGDSAPYGIHVPVERWLGELAVAAGFSSYFFEKTRDRNIKWKNRKHRVPLKEGNLWIKN